MNLKYKITLITLGFGIPAFFLGPVIWPISPILGRPSFAQVPSFQFLSFLEALLFGLGASFMILGWPLAKNFSPRIGAVSIYLSVGWLLLSWWPHDNFHFYAGPSVRTQLLLEFVFHVPTMLAILIVIKGLLEALFGSSYLTNNSRK